jgi:ureidoglycolate lyase
MRVIAEPLAGKGSAPFGGELTIPASGRTFFDGALANLRRSPRPSRKQHFSLPLTQWRMERHAFSSQLFVPVGRLRHLMACNGGEGDEEFDRADADHHPRVTGDAHGRL